MEMKVEVIGEYLERVSDTYTAVVASVLEVPRTALMR